MKTTPHDLYQEAIQHIDNNKLIVSIDDTVLDKPYSQHMDLLAILVRQTPPIRQGY